MKQCLIGLFVGLVLGQIIGLNVAVHYLQKEMKNEVALTMQITDNMAEIVNYLKARH